MRVECKSILNKLSYVFGEKFRDFMISFYLRMRGEHEHLEHFGKMNEDTTIYCIRRRSGKEEGMLSIFTYIMGRIDFADRNGMIPFVDIDWKQETSMFDRYFRLKNHLTREEVYSSKNVLLSGDGCKQVYPGWCNYINTDFNEEKYVLIDKYIDLSEEVKKYWKEQNSLIHPENCLGLYLRGTDYVQLRPKSHPIQPCLKDVKEKIDEILKTESLCKIFLVTEDFSIYEEVMQTYPGNVITISDDKFFSIDNQTKYINERIRETGSVEENNIRYLVKILLLSQCKALVSGRTNGSVVAAAFNGGKYLKKYIFDVGFYK